MAISIDLSIFENFSFNLPISFPFEKKNQTCVEEKESNFGAKQLLSALMWVQERCSMARFVAVTTGKADTSPFFVKSSILNLQKIS